MGRHLADHGYSGPFGLDGLVDTALFRLRASRLAFDPERGEGVVLYADAPPDGRSWRYAVIARNAGGVREREAALAHVFAFEGGG
ncbi:peptide ligase PGM1-related protein [Streptomyces sp. NPDC092307]|uniref:peptide ligase PGM1-related protein n=1 Tax=Streptomyces sp. NPDC092307 TaxID=3366013 RepID=UPI0038164131